MSRMLLSAALLSTALACGVSAGPASAASAFLRTGTSGLVFAGPEGPDSPNLRHNNHIAVEDATGRVFKTDPVNDKVVVYAPTFTGVEELTSFGTGELSDPYGIAIDQSSGDVYVTDSGNSRIVRYTSDGQPVPSYTLDADYTNHAAEVTNFAAAIALDRTDDDLLIADPGSNKVQRYRADGTYDAGGSFDGSAGAGAPGAFTGLQDLAVDSTGDVIVVDALGGDPADGATSSVLRYSASGQYESTIGPVPQAATVAVRPDDDSFVVSGVQDAVNHDAAPSLTWFDASDALLQNVDVNAGDDGRRVMYATISGLAIGAGADGRLYMASDVSRGSYVNQYGVASLQAFEHNVSTAPVIHPSSFTVTDVTDRTARLEAALNPKASETTYHVEYGPTTSYGASTPATSAGAGPSYVSKAQNLVGLTPSTTYHYKVVAQNGIGVSESPDRTFTTAHERPTITVGAVADVTRSTASVPVTINTHGLTGTVFATIAQTNGSYAGLTVPIALAAADAPQETVIGMAGLPAGGTFIVRVKATSGAGLTTTPEFTFATQAPPGYVPRPGGTPDGGNWYDALRSDQGAVPAPGAPSNRFTLKSKVAGTSLALTVGVPGKGTLTASGSQLGSVIKRPAIKGDVRLTLRLTAAGRAALKRAKSKQLRTRVTVRFTPSGGAVHAVTRTITFKRGGAR